MDAVIREQAEDWLLRLVSGQATVADATAFRRWRDAAPEHAQAFASVQRLWDALEPAAREAMAKSRRTSVRRSAGTASGSSGMDLGTRRRRAGRRAFLGAAVTAGAAYVVATSPLGLWPGLSELGADFRTAAGEQKQFELGQVLVELNTRTAVKREEAANVASALAIVRGEVALTLPESLSGRFRVRVAGAQLELHGPGEFNIRCEDGWARIACMRGQGELRLRDAAQTLRAGQQALVEEQSVQSVQEFDAQAVTAWRRQLLLFNGQPLATVIDEVNRYWRGRIVLTNSTLAARAVHMRMTLSQLDNFPNLLADAYGASVRRMPGGVVLIG